MAAAGFPKSLEIGAPHRASCDRSVHKFVVTLSARELAHPTAKWNDPGCCTGHRAKGCLAAAFDQIIFVDGYVIEVSTKGTVEGQDLRGNACAIGGAWPLFLFLLESWLSISSDVALAFRQYCLPLSSGFFIPSGITVAVAATAVKALLLWQNM